MGTVTNGFDARLANPPFLVWLLKTNVNQVGYGKLCPLPPPSELDEYKRRLWFCVFSLLCENMTSSQKPEVHNVSHCLPRRTEPRPPAACTENLVKFVRVVFAICERTDKQTDIHTNRLADRNTWHPYQERSKYWRWFLKHYYTPVGIIGGCVLLVLPRDNSYVYRCSSAWLADCRTSAFCFLHTYRSWTTRR